MVKDEIIREFVKIYEAFVRVKSDMSKLFIFTDRNKEDIKLLKEKMLVLEQELRLVRGKEAYKELKNYSEKENNEYIGNLESKKLHYSNCPFAKNIKPTNRVHFVKIEEGIKEGYNTCSCISQK